MVKNLMQLQNLRWYFAPFVKLYPQFMIDDLKIKINLSILISNLNQPHTHDLDWFKYLQEPPTFFHIRYDWSIIQSSCMGHCRCKGKSTNLNLNLNFCLQKISCSLRPITNQMGTTGSPWIYMKKIKQLVTQSNLFTNQNLSIIFHANDVIWSINLKTKIMA